MLRKIYIVHGGDIGVRVGITNRIIAFAKALISAGYGVGLVAPRPTREVPDELRDVELHLVPIKANANQIAIALSVCHKGKKIAREKGVILQIEYSILGGVAALLGCSNYVLDADDIRFGNSIYSRYPPVSKAIYELEKIGVKRALKVIALSEPMKKFFMNEWDVPEEKIEIITSGIFKEKIERLKRIKCDETDGLVSFMGTLIPEDRDYVKIMKLAKSTKNIRIYIIGDGPLKARLLKMFRGVRNVIFKGYLPEDECYRVLAQSQVCINPMRDTLRTRLAAQLKILDYAALGKAIASDRDAMAMIFEKHRAALVSDPANANEFIKNVHRLLEDSKLRQELGRNARNLVMNFTWEDAGKKLVRLYEEME
jgi:glycosyltransferase involved in cell wall biosynthesis